jgi:uncharacterized Zn-binding protein involved in type VI secretion
VPPAAVMGDKATGVCVHIVMIPSPGGPVPTPTPTPYAATILQGCVVTVLIGGKPAAVMGCGLTHVPPHIPPGFPWGPPPPSHDGTILKGSVTVLIGGRPAARIGDTVSVCTTSVPPSTGAVVGPGAPTVIIGG